MKEIYCRVWTEEGYHDLTQDEWIKFNKNKLHHINGPAVEWTYGTKWWCIYGKLHRDDGPAVEHTDGRIEWWINDYKLSTKEIETWLFENNVDLSSVEDQMAFKLRWS